VARIVINDKEYVEELVKRQDDEEPAEESEGVFDVVEQMPEFPGGQNALIQYLSQNLRYPLIAKENKIQGRTLVSFIVEKDGRISTVEVLRSSGDMMLDREAMRVIRSMPRWRPGYMKGQPVRVQYQVPITFKL
jgi:protein TonB